MRTMVNFPTLSIEQLVPGQPCIVEDTVLRMPDGKRPVFAGTIMQYPSAAERPDRAKVTLDIGMIAGQRCDYPIEEIGDPHSVSKKLAQWIIHRREQYLTLLLWNVLHDAKCVKRIDSDAFAMPLNLAELFTHLDPNISACIKRAMILGMRYRPLIEFPLPPRPNAT
jgi:hypothetical protein